MGIKKNDIHTKVAPEATKKKENKRKIFILLFIIFIIIIIFVVIYLFKIRKDVAKDVIPTESTQNQEKNTTKPESKDPELVKETPSCAPIYTGGEIDSHTSTDTTWSYYFKKATKESVLEYVQNLKSNGWSAISEKTIVNTTFSDLKKEDCYVSLRYHSTDNGVILEIKLKTN